MKTKEEELELALAARMLDCLGTAIGEVQESRRRIKSRNGCCTPRPESYYAERLRSLDDEIENLRALQEKLRSRIDGGRVSYR
jgi:hypothetical protein